MQQKVLIFVNHHIWLYKLRRELIDRLHSEGYQVYLSLPYGEHVDYFIDQGCVFIETSFEVRNKSIFSNINLLRKYKKIVRQVKPDVILTYTIKSNLYGALVSGKKIPCICNITGLGSGFKNNGVLKSLLLYMYRFCLRKADFVFFQNQEDMNNLLSEGIIKAKHDLLPGSGVNLEEFHLYPYPKDNVKVLFNFIGRIMQDKGIDQYLEAAAIVHERFPQTVFRIFGYVEKTQLQYEEKINNYVNCGVVEFHGFKDDIQSEICNSHCTIQPAVYGEGLSNVILESSAMGKAIIASDLPGCKNGVDEGKSGFVFKAGDSKDLARAIEEFLTLSNQEKENMGICAREKVEREFSREIVVSRYMDAIVKAVGTGERDV